MRRTKFRDLIFDFHAGSMTSPPRLIRSVLFQQV